MTGFVIHSADSISAILLAFRCFAVSLALTPRHLITRHTACLLLLALLMPLGIYFGLAATAPTAEVIETAMPREEFVAAEWRFTRGRLGPEPQSPGIITNVQVIDKHAV